MGCWRPHLTAWTVCGRECALFQLLFGRDVAVCQTALTLSLTWVRLGCGFDLPFLSKGKSEGRQSAPLSSLLRWRRPCRPLGCLLTLGVLAASPDCVDGVWVGVCVFISRPLGRLCRPSVCWRPQTGCVWVRLLFRGERKSSFVVALLVFSLQPCLFRRFRQGFVPGE